MEKGQSESFNVCTGVRQGCVLSPTLFLIMIDYVMKKTTASARGIQWELTAKLEDLDFADDLVLISNTEAHMHIKTQELVNNAKPTGLEINMVKRKLPKRALQWTPQGRRKVGRPAIT